jgi:hypothetical protein
MGPGESSLIKIATIKNIGEKIIKAKRAKKKSKILFNIIFNNFSTTLLF